MDPRTAVDLLIGATNSRKPEPAARPVAPQTAIERPGPPPEKKRKTSAMTTLEGAALPDLEDSSDDRKDKQLKPRTYVEMPYTARGHINKATPEGHYNSLLVGVTPVAINT